ncbi:MAG TPA: AMP-binding protein, partial [Acidimicrobiales bacterium]|nr:AMP-binding protein [Acidimicrobiales bacterium]
AVAGLRGPNAVAGRRGPNAVAGLRGPNAVAGRRDPNAVAGLRGPKALTGAPPTEARAAPDGLVLEPWLGTLVRCYPDRVPTLVHALDRAASAFPDRTALETAEGTVTYGDLAELVEGAAERLAEEGLAPGDRLAVCLRNGLDIVVAIWACARAGLLFVGLSTRLAAPQWAYMLRHSGARLALGHPEFIAGLRDAAAEAGLTPDRVREVGDHLTGRRRAWRGATIPFPDEDATYGVIYTSGTTGRPKASRLVHRGAMHSATAYVRTLGLTAADRTAIVFPLFYITGHVAQVTPMMLVGGTSVTVAEVVPRAFVQLMAERRITYLMVVPSLWPLLLRVPEFRWPDLAHVQIGAFGGSPVPLSTVTSLRQRMPQLRLFDLYGLTETHSPATALLDHEFRRKPGSVGRLLPCAEARVVDDDARDVPPGQAGELWLKGPMVTSGYFGDDEATAAAITDGWLHTGDVGRIDDEGYVFVLDRKKDMIMRGGFKVYSVELEYLLVGHPDIAEAAVFGVPDHLAYEAVAAYVVPAEGRTVAPDQVQQWVAARMADYAVPRHVRVVASIPRNRTGKVEKRHLRETFHSESTARTRGEDGHERG